MLHIIWQSSLGTNEKIGALFGITYSAVSHQIKVFKKRLAKDKTLKDKIEAINSQFKI